MVALLLLRVVDLLVLLLRFDQKAARRAEPRNASLRADDEAEGPEAAAAAANAIEERAMVATTRRRDERMWRMRMGWYLRGGGYEFLASSRVNEDDDEHTHTSTSERPQPAVHRHRPHAKERRRRRGAVLSHLA